MTAMTIIVSRDGDAGILHIAGDITSASEPEIMKAYAKASDARTKAIVLDFSGLDYMNSGGIGLLVTSSWSDANRAPTPSCDRRLRPLPPDPGPHAPGRGHRDPRRRGGGHGGRHRLKGEGVNRDEPRPGRSRHPLRRQLGQARRPACRRPASRPAQRTTRSAASASPGRSRGSASCGRRRSGHRYHVGVDLTPRALIAIWKEAFPTSGPKGQRFYAPLSGIAPGEVALPGDRPTARCPSQVVHGRHGPVRGRRVLHVP